MAPKPLPSPNLLRQLLDYDPETGVLTWRTRTPDLFVGGERHTAIHKCNLWNAKHAGKRAGGLHAPTGYLVIRVNGNSFYIHRIAWAIYGGVAPKNRIDHIDGNKANNRIANLRDVTQEQNCRNLKMHADNRSGVNGVSWNAKRRRWCSEIRFQRKAKWLGRFKSFEDAVAARKAAERELGFHPNHGRN